MNDATLPAGAGASDDFFSVFHQRAEAIADACTRCGDCFRACPMTEPGGISAADPGETAGAIVDLITGGDGSEAAIRWGEVCSGSGSCIPACRHGINPRFMVQLARGFARRNRDGAPLNTRWRKTFQGMSRGVRVLSRLQMPPEALSRFKPQMAERSEPPEIVFYTGCNVVKTPHIALLALDMLDLIGVDYEVMGGPGQCCGVYQFREGDFVNNNKMSYATIRGLASAGTKNVLSWCPSCQLSIGEVALPNYEQQFGERPFDLNPYLPFLASHADKLQAMMKHEVKRRVALHERPVFPETMAAVKKLLSIIPGLEFVDIDVPRVGTQANSLAQLPEFKKRLVQQELRAVVDAGVDTIATVYHACHRELCDVGEGRSYEVVNFMELLGDGLGIESEDLFKKFKIIRDFDDIITETAPMIAAHGLDLDTVRDALIAEFGQK